ncbi:hypothetical protein [Streptococcus suis]|uniref:hypothetical protein n=1 Tax=Streptococcus suis TaxID=1307 RepID=UPI00241274C9|nr:hypothetical protein [Streptococcus suis]MDG4519711.1 hypothetical protein [Streptococcus suis]
MKKINKAIMVEITCTIFILYGIATILSDIGVILFSEPIPLTIVICIYLGILGNIETNRLNSENDKNGHSK